MTKWYDQSPWPERLSEGWLKMSPEHQREFLRAGWQNHLKEQYESALAQFDMDGVPWEELSQDKKDRVEQTVLQNAQEMRELGQAIAQGKLPPC
jgi:ABC-type transporter MlaC component